MIRWLDYNDCFLAAEWGHPSDNLGGILAVADWLSRTNKANGKQGIKMSEVLTGMIQAHEVRPSYQDHLTRQIQGCLALENSFNSVGLDHVVLVKVATTAVISRLLGLSKSQTNDAVSQAWVDGQSLRTYRHVPNTGSRKSWAAGDACSRAVNLALMVKKGEMGLPSVLTAKRWGFYDVLFKGNEFKFQRPYGGYIMENVLFKISFPAEFVFSLLITYVRFHAQTAVECAMILHGQLKNLGKTTDDIKEIRIRTQRACIDIIDKQGPLHNPADRDHCVQYMVMSVAYSLTLQVAVPLIFGRLTAEDYEDGVAKDARIDALRAKMYCVEDPQITKDYHDPSKRSIGNGLTITLNDGTTLDEVFIDIPVGHRLRREEVYFLYLHQALMTGKTIVAFQIRQAYWAPLFSSPTGCHFEGE